MLHDRADLGESQRAPHHMRMQLLVSKGPIPSLSDAHARLCERAPDLCQRGCLCRCIVWMIFAFLAHGKSDILGFAEALGTFITCIVSPQCRRLLLCQRWHQFLSCAVCILTSKGAAAVASACRANAPSCPQSLLWLICMALSVCSIHILQLPAVHRCDDLCYQSAG